LSNPTSAVLAFAIFGSLLARDESEAPQLSRRVVVLGAVALLVVVAPRALALVRHGLALHPLASAKQDGAEVQRAVAAAIAACPDSVLAHSESARIAEKRGDGLPIVVTEWTRVLELRPLRVEALMQLAQASARANDYETARSSWERALDLDPGHPAIVRNLATLELNHGHVERGLAWLDRLTGERAPDKQWLETFAHKLALRGVDDASEAVIARADPRLSNRSAEECYALAKEARQASHDEAADAWEARAQRKWARAHAAQGRYADAVRNYRQDLRLCTIHVEGGPTRVKLELAAALFESGRADEARSLLEGVRATPEDLAAIPEWASARLRSELQEAKK
jgi:tetratricopeptide (TPR) repeat protein